MTHKTSSACLWLTTNRKIVKCHRYVKNQLDGDKFHLMLKKSSSIEGLRRKSIIICPTWMTRLFRIQTSLM